MSLSLNSRTLVLGLSHVAKEKIQSLSASLEKYTSFSSALNQWSSIIAVHGLGANPNYAWKHKIETKEGGKLVWP